MALCPPKAARAWRSAARRKGPYSLRPNPVKEVLPIKDDVRWRAVAKMYFGAASVFTNRSIALKMDQKVVPIGCIGIAFRIRFFWVKAIDCK